MAVEVRDQAADVSGRGADRRLGHYPELAHLAAPRVGGGPRRNPTVSTTTRVTRPRATGRSPSATRRANSSRRPTTRSSTAMTSSSAPSGLGCQVVQLYLDADRGRARLQRADSRGDRNLLGQGEHPWGGQYRHLAAVEGRGGVSLGYGVPEGGLKAGASVIPPTLRRTAVAQYSTTTEP